MKMHSPIIEVLKYYDCASLDLFEKLRDNQEIRHIDGVHFTPKGHRVITFYLIRIISNAPEKQNVISSTAQSSSNCHRLSDQNNRNLVYDSSNQKQYIHVHEKRKRNRIDNSFDNEFHSLFKHRTLYPANSHHNKNYDLSNFSQQNHHQCVNRHKQFLFNQGAEQFARAFGIAWSTFRTF
ncbi:unnamed protein product [Rotaria magnacalcarata]|uniref:Uncharacterized protein n=2 Tax=Rotaria magnacalcarata TaxID=392030 RepID=A0A816PIU9_9BILA|nr:unnamed protein product [Rotaria magnacalcarata]